MSSYESHEKCHNLYRSRDMSHDSYGTAILECGQVGILEPETSDLEVLSFQCLRKYCKQWGLGRIQSSRIVSNLSRIEKFHNSSWIELMGVTQSKWKFDGSSSGNFIKKNVEPVPYLIHAVSVEFYTSRIDIQQQNWCFVDNQIESYCTRWHFELLDHSKWEKKMRNFIQTIGFIDRWHDNNYWILLPNQDNTTRFWSFVNHSSY